MNKHSDKTAYLNPQQLDPLSLPLHGKHLIEASAGTGKTFNITRLYLRFLVEKSLSVQEILVMTFTEAATEEIRTRVAAFIDEVLENWESNDPFVAHLKQVHVTRVSNKEHLSSTDSAQKARNLLESAKLSIDDASIFTIHGFCQRVITQFSSSMQENPDARILTQTKERLLQAIADCIIAADKYADDFALLQEHGWHTPHKFYQAFFSALIHDSPPQVQKPANMWEEYIQTVNEHWDDSQGIRSTLIQALQTSNPWLDGLKHSQNNSTKISAEIQSARAFLSRQVLFDEVEAERLYTISEQSEFSLNLTKEALDGGFTILFGGGRNKKYDQQWFEPLLALFNKLIYPIKQPLQSNSTSLNSKMRKCLAFEAVAKIISKAKANLAKGMQNDNLRSYDDLIRVVYQNLVTKDDTGDRADLIRMQLLKQFPIAMIDEFQDTDNQQYGIFKSLYADSTVNALIMIGDPKQAIYGFRGGDVFTYLKARQDADFVWTMDVNWRSTPEMVSAYNHIFSADTETVFDFGIEYLPIRAAQGGQMPRSQLLDNAITSGVPQTEPSSSLHRTDAALQFICADAFRLEDEKLTHVDDQKQQILMWMVNEIKALLHSGFIESQNTELQNIESENGDESIKLQAKDIAILVRAGHEAKLVKQVLQEHGVASVYLSEKSPLFKSPQAQNTFAVLDAIWTGNDQRRCISALATGIFYVNPSHELNTSALLAALIQDHSHPEWQAVYRQNAIYREIWSRDGIYALLLHLITGSFDIEHEGLNAERALTNYQHLAELLAKAAVMHTTESAQLTYLARQLNHEQEDDTAQLRLESDQTLVKIVTQHKSKGLEYPVVFVPFANAAREFKPGNVLKFHRPATEHRPYELVMQLGQSASAKAAMHREDMAEDMRLLYVALTRPIYRAYMGMILTKTSHNSAINRALGLGDVDASSSQDTSMNKEANTADTLVAALQTATTSNNSITVRRASDMGKVQTTIERDEGFALRNQTLTRLIEQRWSLTSFTGIARLMQSQEHDVSSFLKLNENKLIVDDSPINYQRESETQFTATEKTLSDLLVADSIPNGQPLRFSLAKGPDAGNMLHDTLEWLSFDEPDVDAVAEKLTIRHKLFNSLRSDIQSESDLVSTKSLLSYEQKQYFEWIIDCLAAPIAGQDAISQDASAIGDKIENTSSSLKLAQLKQQHVIKEAEFYLPIEHLDCAALTRLLSAHRKRIAQQCDFDATPIKTINRASIAGMLHGFIDLIFQWGDAFYVCDYKSNHIGSMYSDYTKPKVAKDIQNHDYDLQYLLYSMALDRYLQQSLPAYDRNKHFGGVYYLYLRGMTASKTHLQNALSPGVFYTTLSESELKELQMLFAHAEGPVSARVTEHKEHPL